MFQYLLRGNQRLACLNLSAFTNCYLVFGPYPNHFYSLSHLDFAEVTLAFFLLSFNFYSCLFQFLLQDLTWFIFCNCNAIPAYLDLQVILS